MARTWIFAALVMLVGCIEEQRFITPEAGGPYVFAIREDTPPYFASEDGNLYLVEERVEIPFREPTDEELAAMADVGDEQVPYGSLPFVRRGDIELQVDWTISNLADEDVDVAVVVNGFNEFHEYVPEAQVIDDEVVVDFSQWERTLRLAPFERRSGTVREEEMDEVAVDLASVVNGATNANLVVYFENQSSIDPRSRQWVPSVVPALTGVRIGLRSEAALPVVIEATVRVRDVRRVLVQGDDEPWQTPAPAIFNPSSLMAAN